MLLEHETSLDTVCPHCGFEMDACTALEGKAVPKPGDLSVCSGCAKVCQYDDDLALKFVTKEVWMQVPEDVKQKIKICCRTLRDINQRKTDPRAGNSRTTR